MAGREEENVRSHCPAVPGTLSQVNRSSSTTATMQPLYKLQCSLESMGATTAQKRLKNERRPSLRGRMVKKPDCSILAAKQCSLERSRDATNAAGTIFKSMTRFSPPPSELNFSPHCVDYSSPAKHVRNRQGHSRTNCNFGPPK